MAERKHLRVDPARRIGDRQPKLAQYVRATDEQGYTETVAVEELDRESLLVWVHSRSSRAFVEDCVGHLLGHGALHFKSPLGAYPGPVPALASLDPIEVIDRDIDQILERPGMHVPSLPVLDLLLIHLLSLRCELAGIDYDARAALLRIGGTFGFGGDARGPGAVLSDRNVSMDSPEALHLYWTWVAEARALQAQRDVLVRERG